MTRTVRAGVAAAVLVVLAAGCAKSEPATVAVSGDELPVEGAATLQVMLPDEEGEPAPTDPTYKIEVTSPIDIVMAATGYTIVPAGTEQVRSGHFHLHWAELDPDEDASKAETVCTEVGETIPQGDDVQHFGDGATEATIELDPGVYRLCLQLGDGAHTALDARHEYTIVVVDEPGDEGSDDGDASDVTLQATTTTVAEG